MADNILRTQTAPGFTGITGSSAISSGATTISAAYNFNSFTGDELVQIIHEHLSPRVAYLANKSDVFLSKLPSKTVQGNPRGVRIATESRANASQSYFASGGLLSPGDAREFLSMNVFFSRTSQGTRLTLDSLQTMEKGQALETLKSFIVEDTRDFMKYVNFDAFRNGLGVRAEVDTNTGAIAAGATATIDFSVGDGCKGLQVWGLYDVIDTSAANAKLTTTGYMRVESIDVANQTAVCRNLGTAAITIDDGDWFVKYQSFGLSVAGLEYIIDDTLTGNIFGIPRSTDARYRATIDRSGGALTVAKMNKLVQEYKFKKGADKWVPGKKKIVSSPTQFNAYLNLGDPTVNATNSGVRLVDTVKNGGLDFGYQHSQVMYQGIEWIEDSDCQNNAVWIPDVEHLQRVEFLAPQVYSPLGNGQKLMMIPAFDSAGTGTFMDQALYEIVAKWNLATDDPSAHLALLGLSVTSLAQGFTN